ncbi:MAG: hydrogenase maturation nickel metallochaperone HypA [Deltaproteobacteria bacterium]|jgi:hydrogenase nickel incorporation protein HypA/HybF|nr:hydrogenase maturation nickel metallochaperone HypA [Deltaproteobacteria bacterium]
MHEFSIALGIIEIAEENARKADAKVIHEIEIEVGTLSGVMTDALKNALEVAVENTILKNTKRTFLELQAKGRCESCSCEFELNGYMTPCPTCQGFNFDIIQGQELRVKSLSVD